LGRFSKTSFATGSAEKALGQPALKAKWVMTSRGLRLREAVIHRPVEVAAKLRDLAGSNQGADRDQTRTSRDVRFRAARGGKAEMLQIGPIRRS
jgi:hypothetical protein